MTKPMMDLRELVEKSGDAGLLQEILLEPVAKRSFDPVDQLKVERGRRPASPPSA